VSLKATQVDGTSAGLQYQDEISVKDLMYGMMLPSGNDAATCLAEAFGVLMYKDK
jgi:D-alanyl-D-alanine carboxypeptidase